jgi:hypothetical protein
MCAVHPSSRRGRQLKSKFFDVKAFFEFLKIKKAKKKKALG